MLVFWLYYIWIIFGILSVLFVKTNVVDRYDKPITFPGWVYFLYFISLCIPLINVATSLIILQLSLEDGYIKKNTKKWFKNLWIVKILVKQY